MPRQPRFAKSALASAGCALVAAVSTFLTPAAPAVADGSPSGRECEPLACAATYIGVPTSTLRAELVDEVGRTSLLGLQTVIDQLDDAMSRKLSAMAPTPQGALVESYVLVIAEHHTIRQALLDLVITAQRC